MTARILALDIETAPTKAYVWGLYDQNIGINQIISNGYMLCWCASWVGSKDTLCDALPHHQTFYRKDPTNDKRIAESVWKVLDEADIIVAQNGRDFDIKWLNDVFLKHHIKPPSPFKVIDTLKESRKHFFSVSHKLDFRVRQLNVGGKTEHEGFGLWVKCMNGDLNAWDRMVDYCRNDVVILKNYYERLKPYMTSHPNLRLYDGEREKCVVCGSANTQKRGYAYTTSEKYQRYQCSDCGRWMRVGKKDEVKRGI